MEEEDKEVISYTINGISYAIWNADKEKFEYVRYKFGTSYIERLNCIEDVFIPYNEVNTILFQLVTNFLKENGCYELQSYRARFTG